MEESTPAQAASRYRKVIEGYKSKLRSNPVNAVPTESHQMRLNGMKKKAANANFGEGT